MVVDPDHFDGELSIAIIGYEVCVDGMLLDGSEEDIVDG